MIHALPFIMSITVALPKQGLQGPCMLSNTPQTSYVPPLFVHLRQAGLHQTSLQYLTQRRHIRIASHITQVHYNAFPLSYLCALHGTGCRMKTSTPRSLGKTTVQGVKGLTSTLSTQFMCSFLWLSHRPFPGVDPSRQRTTGTRQQQPSRPSIENFP